MGPAIVSQPDGPRTDALVEAEGDREAIHWRRPSFNLSWGQWAHLDTTTRRGSAKRNAAFTLQHGAMLTTRQPEGCVPVVVSRCAWPLWPRSICQDNHERVCNATGSALRTEGALRRFDVAEAGREFLLRKHWSRLLGRTYGALPKSL